MISRRRNCAKARNMERKECKWTDGCCTFSLTTLHRYWTSSLSNLTTQWSTATTRKDFKLPTMSLKRASPTGHLRLAALLLARLLSAIYRYAVLHHGASGACWAWDPGMDCFIILYNTVTQPDLTRYFSLWLYLIPWSIKILAQAVPLYNTLNKENARHNSREPAFVGQKSSLSSGSTLS